MTYRELFSEIYQKHKRQLLFFMSATLIWSMFLFPGGFHTAFADTAINTPSALSLESFGSSSATLATSLMQTIGVSADPYAVLTFIGTVSRLSDYFNWNLNISPGLMQYDIIFIMVAILFILSKTSKCFGSTKALSMIHFGEIEKWVGFIFTALLSSSIFIDYVTGHYAALSASTLFVCIGIPGASASGISIALNVVLVILSFVITLTSWAIYYLVKLFFDFLDIITLPLSMIPGATFLYESIKTMGVLGVMLTIMFFPIIGLMLCILIVIIATVFFKKSYAAMQYFRKIYFKPFFRGIFGYANDIPFVSNQCPGKVKKMFPDADITLALPVYNVKALQIPRIKRYVKLWLVCANGQMYLCLPALKSKNGFTIHFANTPDHPIYLKQSRRFFEIFCTPSGEDMTKKYAKIAKEYHLVLSKEYVKRIAEIHRICGYAQYIPVKKKKEEKVIHYMSILNVENLTHGFGDRAIFQNVSFRLLKGEHIGLIGANGEGKSTFMNIITGKLMPDEGTIEWAKNVRVGYLDQHTALEKGMTVRDVLASAFLFLYDMEERMNTICDKMGEADEEELNNYMEELGTIQDLLTFHDFYMIDAKVEEVARALGLMDIGLDRDVTDLSGGQRTKVLLGKLLLEKPDILLLDEPTNYLDAVHIEWLKRYLNEYENAFILISHDIPFLNSVVNLIYHMDNQELNRYVGDYDKFQEVYAMKKSQLEAAYNKQQKEIADLKDFVARNKARVATRNMAMSRQKKLDKMDVIELSTEKPKPEFHFKEARTPGRYIFQTKDLVIGYDEPLSSPLNLEMERGQKIALIGANGIGKTTLLKSILGILTPLSGSVEQGDYLSIGYFEQEIKPDITTTCLEELWQEFPGFTQYEARSALAKCGLTTKHIESKVKVLSGGEQAKMRLCKLINRETNILLLDEPTNHLDVDAKEELKRALKEYKGSILMVCHEPEFYEGLATDVWDCTKWTTKIF